MRKHLFFRTIIFFIIFFCTAERSFSEENYEYWYKILPYARLSNAVYTNENVGFWSRLLPNGEPILPSSDESNDIFQHGYHVNLYHNHLTNKNIIVFEGTDPAVIDEDWNITIEDWKANIDQVFNEVPAQYKFAAGLISYFLTPRVFSGFQTSQSNIEITGHSLGGGLSQYACLQSNFSFPAITFNSAGLFQTFDEVINGPFPVTNIRAYKGVMYDPVSALGNHYGQTIDLNLKSIETGLIPLFDIHKISNVEEQIERNALNEMNRLSSFLDYLRIKFPEFKLEQGSSANIDSLGHNDHARKFDVVWRNIFDGAAKALIYEGKLYLTNDDQSYACTASNCNINRKPLGTIKELQTTLFPENEKWTFPFFDVDISDDWTYLTLKTSTAYEEDFIKSADWQINGGQILHGKTVKPDTGEDIYNDVITVDLSVVDRDDFTGDSQQKIGIPYFYTKDSEGTYIEYDETITAPEFQNLEDEETSDPVEFKIWNPEDHELNLCIEDVDFDSSDGSLHSFEIIEKPEPYICIPPGEFVSFKVTFTKRDPELYKYSAPINIDLIFHGHEERFTFKVLSSRCPEGAYDNGEYCEEWIRYADHHLGIEYYGYPTQEWPFYEIMPYGSYHMILTMEQEIEAEATFGNIFWVIYNKADQKFFRVARSWQYQAWKSEQFLEYGILIDKKQYINGSDESIWIDFFEARHPNYWYDRYEKLYTLDEIYDSHGIDDYMPPDIPPAPNDWSWWDHKDPETGEWVTCEE